MPPDTFELTKRQLRAATNDRIAALRAYDDQVTRLWEARVADGRIARYMGEPQVALEVGARPDRGLVRDPRGRCA